VIPPEPPYDLTVNTQGQGNVNPPGGTYLAVTDVLLTALPETGWMFSHWEGDLSGSVNPENLLVDRDRTVTAVFIEIPPNQAPSVDAGSDQSVILPSTAFLDGTVTDDGVPPQGVLTTVWSQISGPSTATFADAFAVDTTASFTTTGTYVLRLTADDSELFSFDELSVTVHPEGVLADTIEIRVATGNDDAEEEASGSVSRGSSDLELIRESSDQTVGMRFNGATIPQGAAISNAYVQFQVDETDSGATYLTIQGQDIGHAPTFSSSSGDISSRARTTASVSWNPLPWTSTGQAGPNQQTSDIASVIQEIVSRSDWFEGNSLVIIITGAGKRVAESYNGSSSGAPLLHVEYVTGPVANRAPNVDAGQDQTVTLPSGASLDATVTDDGLPSSTLTTTWSKLSGPGSVTFANASAVDTTAWFTAAGSYVLELTANDGELSSSNLLSVTVNPQGTQAETIENRIETGNDDAEELSSGSMYLTSSDLELVYDSGNQKVGMRFNGVTIPQDAAIANAYIQFQADESHSGATDLAIQGQDIGNAPIFTSSSGNISSRARTTASVSWNPVPWSTGQAGSAQQTPDIASVIQEIVNRSDWFEGNSLVIIITGTGERVAESYNGTSSGAPLLHVEYTTGPAANQPPNVGAGPDQTVTFPNSASLSGTLTDDGLPNPPGAVTCIWSKVSGPGTVTFGDANALNTTATFSVDGAYVLRLSADDGELNSSDEVTVTVNQAPIVDVGVDQTITLPDSASLDGTVNDDGLPNPPGTVTAIWSKVSGPGTVTFANASAIDTTASFSEAGVYVLRLTADDSDSSTFDDLSVTVNPQPNQPPSVGAGSDLTVTLPDSATLDGSVSDDGLPNPPGAVTTLWSMTSGPGTVTYGNALAVDTTASFSGDGTYVLRLTADDSDLDAFDELTITVNPQPNQAPTVNVGLDQTITLPNSATLDATVTDDGLPSSALTTTWSQMSGPADAATFTDASAVDTTVSFSEAGIYVLRLTADDSDLDAFDELTVTVNLPNQAPTVNVGLDQTITLPNSATLDATVTDDGLPNPPGAVTTLWSKASGPGTVTFGNAGVVDTTATFSVDGEYVLRLTADDSDLDAFDELTVTVNPQPNQAPTVNVGLNQTITLPNSATLDATVTDDGLPNPPGAVTTLWSMTSGPGTVTFGDATAVDTTATFSVDGEYVLRLTADDSDLDAFDELTVTVNPQPANQAPNVDAGPDQTVTLPSSAVLDGTVTDDGLPSVTLTITWSQVNGPGTVTFGNASAVDTTASFTTDGTYTLRLTADDGQLDSFDELRITVNPEVYQVNTIEIRVNTGNDDAEESASGSISRGSSDLELVRTSSNQTVGMRFNGATIPQGANITNAYIQFQVDETDSEATSLTIRGQDVGNAPSFSSSSGNISSRARTTASVSWNPAPWTSTGQRGPNQQTPDIASVIQEIVSRSDWYEGNSLVIIITGTGKRVAESYNGSSSGAPLLHVEYTTGPVANRAAVAANWTKVSGPGSVTFSPSSAVDTTASFSTDGEYVLRLTADDGELTTSDDVTVTVYPVGTQANTIEIRIETGNDDAEERSSGSMYLTSSDLELVYDSGNQKVGMRFNGVTIPQGATISNAYIQFQADESHSGATYLTIQGQDIGNAPIFTSSSGNISSRARTTASVSWEPVPWRTTGQAGPDQQTPNIASVIQEIVLRSNWSSGNSLVIIITGTGERVAESYNGSNSGAPLLHVEYHSP